MSLSVKCPDCDKTLKVKDELAGKKVKCPGCSAVVKVPAGTADELDDVEFLDDVEDDAPPKRKRRSAARDEEIEDYDDAPAQRSRSRKPAKMKSRKQKSGGTNWLPIIGGGTGALSVVVMLIAGAVRQGGQPGASTAHWPTFKHPLGVVQVDMPGVPTFNAAESKDGAQTYSLTQKTVRFSVTAFMYDANVLQVVATNPAAYDLMFAEIEKAVPIQKPGAKILLSQRFHVGSVRGLEMKITAMGMTNLVRFYAFPNSMVAAEFVTKNESSTAADRDRFFASLRGPDGNLVNGGGGGATAPPPTAAHGMTTSQAAPIPGAN